jgi:hypothetical protein
MTPIPTDPNTRLRRKEAAATLTAAGFPISSATLASAVTLGHSPPFRIFNRVALYTWGDLLTWAEGRLSAPRGTPPETDRKAA